MRTGGPRDFAWGAADAAGSVISSAKDMSLVLKTLLGTEKRFEKLLPSNVLDDMMRGQMIVPPEWIKSCGIVQPSGQRGDAVAAGLGLDISASVALTASQKDTYVEKNGDTNMHKARLGIFPGRKAGILLMSNLGGAMGGQLSALKWGALAILQGASAETATSIAMRSLNVTNFKDEQWIPGTTCTPCGSAGASRRCEPSSFPNPPFDTKGVEGRYTSLLFEGTPWILESGDENDLRINFGPCERCKLKFDQTSFAIQAPCSEVASHLPLSQWSNMRYEKRLANLKGRCSLAQFVLPPEISQAGISQKNRTVAFPWGCGGIPLPDGPSVYIFTNEGKGVLISLGGEAMFRADSD